MKTRDLLEGMLVAVKAAEGCVRLGDPGVAAAVVLSTDMWSRRGPFDGPGEQFRVGRRLDGAGSGLPLAVLYEPDGVWVPEVRPPAQILGAWEDHWRACAANRWVETKRRLEREAQARVDVDRSVGLLDRLVDLGFAGGTVDVRLGLAVITVPVKHAEALVAAAEHGKGVRVRSE